MFTKQEVQSILRTLDGTKALMTGLLYGSGLRITECLRLGVKDIDFGYGQIIVRDGKGQKDRVTVLPASFKHSLRRHLEKAKALHERELAEGYGWTTLPNALGRKYPNAARQWGWQFVFPSAIHCDPAALTASPPVVNSKIEATTQTMEKPLAQTIARSKRVEAVRGAS